ncbi:HDIG domain-containing protein [Malonomonas rubra DSM 5091]|uniref:HDIG domain-containing protein n=1 Tax=Malonomonas rubra DSM 5091 TaxID=1122189 RepID=A0A1M6CE44_MALRU|nr:HD domain-containing phosphohydrolase [Malonomonas rubra]SHI59272.1 HDIG domain-containing protein [Malonomonas rubra DSM 5091]
MNSLKIKILGITILITIAAVTVATWHNVQTQSLMVKQMVGQNSRILARTIHNSLTSAMLSGRNQDVIVALQKIATEPTVHEPRIFDQSGRILFSANETEIGRTVPVIDLITFRNNPSDFGLAETDGTHFVTTLPIRNTAECRQCHPAEKELLGIFSAHLGLESLLSLQQQGKQASFFTSVSLLLVMIICLVGFVLYYVDTPIRKLTAAMTHLEQGNFDAASTSIHSSREMALLSNKFNRMVEGLKHLLNTTVLSERERAADQEKLRHKDKIDSMHMTLEERLNEIENLNSTLEERVHEVEDANFRISDLAANLEDRNTTLAKAVNRLSTLYEMGLVINSTMELKNLFHLLLEKALESLHADVGYILLYDKVNNTLRIGDVIGVPIGFFDPEMSIKLIQGGVSHWVIENREPLLIKRIEDAREFSRMSKLGFARDTVICAPLFTQDEVIGTITIANRRDESLFYEEDLEILSTIAAQASVAIKNARLYEEQQSTYLSTVQALVSAIEASDPYTRGHSERVTRYSVALAHKLNLNESAFRDLEQAAILHDIGKIGIDDSLLHKVETLSLDDVDRLRQHPLIGMRILEPIHFMARVREVIGQHHERFDGSGYPLGITGQHLLLESRILAVADSFDAMTSDRPYRNAMPTSVAISEIEANSGTQFDPEVAKAFVELVKTNQL